MNLEFDHKLHTATEAHLELLAADGFWHRLKIRWLGRRCYTGFSRAHYRYRGRTFQLPR